MDLFGQQVHRQQKAEDDATQVVNSAAKEVTMTTQRTTMVLLSLLVIGVWGLLLRPAATPIPVRAQNGSSNSSGFGLVATASGIYLCTPSGYVYHFAHDLTLQDRALPPDAGRHDPTYTAEHMNK
jgi:hypothetical protein